MGQLFTRMRFYGLLGAGMVIGGLIFPEDVLVPKWPVTLGVILCIAVAMDQSWEAFKRKGKAGITDLPPTEGGHSTVHPYDIRPASEYDDESKQTQSYTVFALGGWMFGNMYFEGKGPFIVAPPEYCEDTESAFICHAKLQPVKYKQMPKFVKTELLKLRYFNPITSKDLYFGATSIIDGSDTAENRQAQEKFLDQNTRIEWLETQLTDVLEIQKKRAGNDMSGYLRKDDLKNLSR